MPGIEKCLARYPQLYSRIGFAHHRPLGKDELTFVLTSTGASSGLNSTPPTSATPSYSRDRPDRVLADRCSHMSGPLSGGDLDGACLTCP